MEVVPYRVSGAAADQSLERRLFQICGFTIHITSNPRDSSSLRPNSNVNGHNAEGPVNHQSATSTSEECGPARTRSSDQSQAAHLADVGKVVWQSGFVLAELLLRVPPFGHEWRDVRAVDLGTGTGVVGIALAMAGAITTLTDLPHITPLAQANAQANCDDRWHRALVVPYCWGEEPGEWAVPPPDLITGGDIIYEPEHFDALVASICKLSAPHTLTFLAYRHRNRGESEFEVKATAAGLALEAVPDHLLHPEYQDGQYRVIRLCRLG